MFAVNRAWEIDREVMFARSERRAWTVALASVTVACLAVAVDFARGALRQVVPIPIVVDRATGETSVQMPLSSATVPVEDALDKHFLVQFVTAREGYDWYWLVRDYNTVARMAGPEVFAPYASLFDASKGASITDRLSDRTQWRVSIVSVRFSAVALDQAVSSVRKREAAVTFERLSYGVRERAALEAPRRFVAAVRFEYRPKLVLTEAERIENPLGFVVTAYRTDAELVGAVERAIGAAAEAIVAANTDATAAKGRP